MGIRVTLLVTIWIATAWINSTEASRGHCKCQVFLAENKVKILSNHCHRGYKPHHQVSKEVSVYGNEETIEYICHCTCRSAQMDHAMRIYR